MIAERKTVLALVAVTTLAACSDGVPEEAVASRPLRRRRRARPSQLLSDGADDCGDRGAGVRHREARRVLRRRASHASRSMTHWA